MLDGGHWTLLEARDRHVVSPPVLVLVAWYRSRLRCASRPLSFSFLGPGPLPPLACCSRDQHDGQWRAILRLIFSPRAQSTRRQRSKNRVLTYSLSLPLLPLVARPCHKCFTGDCIIQDGTGSGSVVRSRSPSEEGDVDLHKQYGGSIVLLDPRTDLHHWHFVGSILRERSMKRNRGWRRRDMVRLQVNRCVPTP